MHKIKNKYCAYLLAASFFRCLHRIGLCSFFLCSNSKQNSKREARSLSCLLTLSIKEYLFLLCALHFTCFFAFFPSSFLTRTKTKQKCLNLVSFCKHLLLEGDFDDCAEGEGQEGDRNCNGTEWRSEENRWTLLIKFL